MVENGKMPFLSHLEELRKRLIVCIAAVAIGFAVSYAFKERVFGLLMGPLARAMGPEQKMIYTALPMVFVSTGFFSAGVCFAYFIVFPFAFKYLLGFETDLARALPSMREYLGLASALLIAFGFGKKQEKETA